MITNALEISHLYKHYGLQSNLFHKLKYFNFRAGKNKSYINHKPALYDISFNVKKGESFGIIGRNGSGKSTLLQIIAGTLKQSNGSCTVNGRLSALLELGSGFNPDFSGKENIFLSGAILGISKKDMEQKIPEIEAFADIGNYINEPVRTYSTGMLMRVAFAVAISVQPDILIIDEALSVGDIIFQQKCNIRIKELLDAGVTLIVVTHDTSFVLNICSKALWLHEGRAMYLGTASDCVREYLSAMAAIVGNNNHQVSLLKGTLLSSLPVVDSLVFDSCESLGDGKIYVDRVWLVNSSGNSTTIFNTGEWIHLYILVKARIKVTAVSAGCELRDRHGQVIFATGLRVIRKLVDKLEPQEAKLIKIKFKAELAAAQYTLDVGCGAGETDGNNWHRIKSVAIVKITSQPQNEVIHGFVRLPTEIEICMV